MSVPSVRRGRRGPGSSRARRRPRQRLRARAAARRTPASTPRVLMMPLVPGHHDVAVEHRAHAVGDRGRRRARSPARASRASIRACANTSSRFWRASTPTLVEGYERLYPRRQRAGATTSTAGRRRVGDATRWQRAATSAATASGRLKPLRLSRGPSSAWTRSSVGGCVENSVIDAAARERLHDEHVRRRRIGVDRHLLARPRRSAAAPCARPIGEPTISAPPRSAANSRWREIAA